MDTEGSVMVDGQNPDITGTDTENIEKSGESGSETKTDSEDTKAEGTEAVKTGEGTEDKGAEGTDDQRKTEKGTKLADDPLQQANQLRANAESKVRRMEEFLSDPKRLKAYLAELEAEGGEDKPKDGEDDAPIDPDKLETVDDLKKFAKQLVINSEKRIKAIEQRFTGMETGERVKQTANRIGSEIKAVQDKYPELREFNADGTKNPEYNEELDKAIGEFYSEIDYDPRAKMYRGQHSIMKIADRFMGVRTLGEKNGTEKAQTIIKDKRTGRIITNQQGDSGTATDDSKLSASATIAERMKKAALRARR